MTTIKVRAKADNCSCWKKGEVFEAREIDGSMEIACHAASSHILLDSKNRDCTLATLPDCPDFDIVKD